MSDLESVKAESERVANLCMNRGQEIKRLKLKVELLEARVACLTRLNFEQARLLDCAEMSPRVQGRSSVLAGVRVDAGIDEC